MQAAVDGYWQAGNYAIAVTDLQTGETVGVYADRPQLAGCVMKFFVLYQVALDLQAGHYGVERVDQLAAATTWSSNAATARALYEVVGDGDTTAGVRRVAELLERLGLEASLIDHPPGYHAHSLGIDYNNWVTAAEVNLALASLYHGELLEEPWRTWLLDHLANVKPGLNYLTAAVPEGTVSHKNGFFPGDTGYVDSDAGIVRLQRAEGERAYAVTFLSEEVPVKYGDLGLGQQLVTLAYEAMAARYP